MKNVLISITSFLEAINCGVFAYIWALEPPWRSRVQLPLLAGVSLSLSLFLSLSELHLGCFLLFGLVYTCVRCWTSLYSWISNKFSAADWLKKTESKDETLSAGGITSGWFCLESTLLALAIGGTAFSFYLNRTTKNARRMFHASLLYLPVFMSGLLFHRVSDNEQLLGEENSERIGHHLSSSVQEIEIVNPQKKAKCAEVGAQARPPVAYASVAPFPFLPAPTYPLIHWGVIWCSAASQ